MKKLFRVIDVESTGLDPALDRVCEVATVDLLVTQQEDATPIVERGNIWSSLVDPERPISLEAMAVHDITDEMVAGQPKFPALLGTLKAGSPDAYCAHNAKFDSAFFKPAGIPWICTYKVALWLWPDSPSHKNSVLRYYLKLKLAPPAEVAQRAHSALWDAYVTAAILRRAFMRGATFDEMIQVSSEPAVLRKFTFGKHAMKPITEIDGDYLQWLLTARDMDEDVKHTAIVELARRRDAQNG